MSERSPSAYPSYKPDPTTARMAVAGSGLIPRKATLEPPILPANRSSVAYPLARRGSRARSWRRHCCLLTVSRTGRPISGPSSLRPHRSRTGIVLGVTNRVYRYAARRLGWAGTNPVSLMLPSDRPKPS